MITAAWFLLAVLLPDQASTWSLPYPSSIHLVSTANQLTGEELLRIGEIHDHQNHFPETLTYYQLALTTFRTGKQPRGIATALVKIAQVRERQGKVQEASVALQEALPILARSSDRLAYAQALLVMGRVSTRLGNMEVAEKSLTQAIMHFDRVKERRGRNEALIQLGLLQAGNHLTEQGLSSLNQAREDANTRQDRGQQLAATVALGNAQWLLDQEKKARPYYEDGLHLAEAERNIPAQAILRLRIAQLDGENDRLAEGIEAGNQALLLSQTLRDSVTEAATLSVLADLYRKAGRTAEAEESEQHALSIYRHRQIFVHGAG